MSSSSYIPRYIDHTLTALLAELPAVMLTGARGCGKTTTALRHTRSVLRLDRTEEADAFRTAPDAVLGSKTKPVLIDEWQVAPETMGAVKRAVDADESPGRFVITGSVRARRASDGWPATGRVTPIAMHGLTVGELESRKLSNTVNNLILGNEEPTIGALPDAPALVDYLAHALRGGFPRAVALSEFARSAWYEGYVDQLIRHDVSALAEVRSPTGLSALLHAVALNSAGTPAISTLAAAAGIDHRTAMAYLALLEDLRIIDRVPSWSTNRLSRMLKSPKYYIVDSGLAAHLADDTLTNVLKNADRLGRLIDTFVLTQLRPLLHLSRPSPGLFHLRDANQDREVDLLLESQSGKVVGIEVKASESVDPRSARHLAWLRDRLGDTFHRGVVLHTGSMTFPLGDRLWAMPIATLWR